MADAPGAMMPKPPAPLPRRRAILCPPAVAVQGAIGRPVAVVGATRRVAQRRVAGRLSASRGHRATQRVAPTDPIPPEPPRTRTGPADLARRLHDVPGQPQGASGSPARVYHAA